MSPISSWRCESGIATTGSESAKRRIVVASACKGRATRRFTTSNARAKPIRIRRAPMPICRLALLRCIASSPVSSLSLRAALLLARRFKASFNALRSLRLVSSSPSARAAAIEPARPRRTISRRKRANCCIPASTLAKAARS
jgi:hypothetical protein